MIDPRLISYVKNNIIQGYSTDAIKQTLLNSGYSPDVVDESINQAAVEIQQQGQENSSQEPNSNYQNTPNYQEIQSSSYGIEQQPQQERTAETQLTQYVRQLIQQGYPPDMIRNSLLNQGYSRGNIEDSITTAAMPLEVKHTVSISTGTIVAIFLILISLGLLGFGGYYIFNNEEKHILDYSINIDDNKVKTGEFIYYTDKFNNLGSKKSYDVIIEHSIVNLKTNETIDSWKETIAIDLLHNNNGKKRISSETKPGNYEIKGSISVATTKDKLALASQRFVIIKENIPVDNGTKPQEESCSDNLRNQGEDEIDCGGPCEACKKEESCKDNIKNQGETEVDCGGPCAPCVKPEDNKTTTGPVVIMVDSSANDNDKIDKMEIIAEKNPEEGKKLCADVIQSRRKDDCFVKLSSITNSSTYCKNIVTDSKRDVCYMYFVQQGDYSVCEELVQQYTKMACNSLKDFKANSAGFGLPTGYAIYGINSTYIRNDTSTGNETNINMPPEAESVEA